MVERSSNADAPSFAEGYGWQLPDGNPHLYQVELYVPKGASDSLKLLIADAQFTMQWGFDALGAGDRKDALDFTALRSSSSITSSAGGSHVEQEHDQLKTQPGKSEAITLPADQDVKVNTNDSAVLISETFKKLKGIVDTLNGSLQFNFSGPTPKCDSIVYASPVGSDGHTVDAIYTLDKSSGRFYLTPEVELKYFVSALETASRNWGMEYSSAIEEFHRNVRNVAANEGADTDDQIGHSLTAAEGFEGAYDGVSVEDAMQPGGTTHNGNSTGPVGTHPIGSAPTRSDPAAGTVVPPEATGPTANHGGQE